MKEQIVKKYIKALMQSLKGEELVVISNELRQISEAFLVDKFINIIYSPDVSKEKKVDLIISFIEKPSKILINLTKLLAKNDRLPLIPSLALNLSKEIAKQKNEYFGNIEGNFLLSKEQIAKLEERFSKKFDALIKLEAKQSNYSGIKIELDDLGVEVSFSIDRLKSQITEHILKAL